MGKPHTAFRCSALWPGALATNWSTVPAVRASFHTKTQIQYKKLKRFIKHKIINT